MKKKLLKLLSIPLVASILSGCATRKYVKNHDRVGQGSVYTDNDRFKTSFLNIDGTSYAVKTIDSTYMNDSTIKEKNVGIQGTQRDYLTLKEGGEKNTFIWDPIKTFTFAPTKEKIYLGKINVSRKVEKNKTKLTDRDYKTNIEQFFDEKPIEIGNKTYFAKRIGNKLYLIEISKNKRSQKFNELTNLGTQDYFIQSKEGTDAIYVATLPGTKEVSKSNLALIQATSQKQVQSDLPVYRIINSGETLFKVAQEHGITLKKLLELNPNIANPNQVFPGQKIKVK